MGGLHPKFIEILCNSATDYYVRFSKNSLFASNFISSVQIFALTFGWLMSANKIRKANSVPEQTL